MSWMLPTENRLSSAHGENNVVLLFAPTTVCDSRVRFCVRIAESMYVVVRRASIGTGAQTGLRIFQNMYSYMPACSFPFRKAV
jgi:hypothetical protein